MLSFPPMKKFRFIALIAISLMIAASASAQSKVASVDMKKLFNGYWKTKQAESLLDKDKADARKNLKDMADGIDKATTDYKALLDQASDPAISADERTKRKQAADDKAKEINTSKVAFQQFQRQVESTLADKSQRYSGNLVTEIQKAVSDKAKLGSYTLVVNSANPEAVVYVSPDNDLTDSVLSQLNAGAPIDVSGSTGGGLPLNVSTNSLP
jgi:outer membrane protein